MRRFIRPLTTLLLIGLIVVLGKLTWSSYVYSPWTRDARIRAKIVTVAPDESGWVSRVNFEDNQIVNKGDLIFQIDDDLIRAELAERRALSEKAKLNYQFAKAQMDRRVKLVSIGAISAEDMDASKNKAELSKAEYDIAKANLAKANISYQRTKVYAPVSGKLMNLTLHEGNYVHQGTSVLSIVDEGSFYVTGYFEETTMPNVFEGQTASIYLTSSDQVLTGKVKGISPGIANANTVADGQMLPQVQQAFNWVRLSQRIPVDIEISDVGKRSGLIAGMGASVQLEAR